MFPPHDWRGTPALHLPAIKPLYVPSLDFSSVSEYPAYSVMWCASVTLTSALPLVLLVMYDSGLFVLPLFLFSPSVVTLFVLLECQAQSPSLLLVVLCLFLPISLWAISIGLFCPYRFVFTWSVTALGSHFCESRQIWTDGNTQSHLDKTYKNLEVIWRIHDLLLCFEY